MCKCVRISLWRRQQQRRISVEIFASPPSCVSVIVALLVSEVQRLTVASEISSKVIGVASNGMK